MKIIIICSEMSHPIIPLLTKFSYEQSPKHSIIIINNISDIEDGDILFLVSCHEKVSLNIRKKFKSVLVLHASDLPKGRGWSPHIWDILEGKTNITLSLIEAEEAIDTGRIWKKVKIPIPRDFLWDEINTSLFKAEIKLIKWAIDNFKNSNPIRQNEAINPTYRRKRNLNDSKLDIHKTINEQFDLMRVCDPNRYSAFFEIHGIKYKIKLEKYDE